MDGPTNDTPSQKRASVKARLGSLLYYCWDQVLLAVLDLLENLQILLQTTITHVEAQDK